MYVYVCVRCITVRALDCRVVCRTEKSGLVKSRNSVIVTLERWRVRTSLFDLLASCSAVLTICFLFVGFQQSTAQSLALCRLWPFANLDFLGCLLPSEMQLEIEVTQSWHPGDSFCPISLILLWCSRPFILLRITPLGLAMRLSLTPFFLSESSCQGYMQRALLLLGPGKRLLLFMLDRVLCCCSIECPSSTPTSPSSTIGGGGGDTWLSIVECPSSTPTSLSFTIRGGHMAVHSRMSLIHTHLSVFYY